MPFFNSSSHSGSPYNSKTPIPIGVKSISPEIVDIDQEGDVNMSTSDNNQNDNRFDIRINQGQGIRSEPTTPSTNRKQYLNQLNERPSIGINMGISKKLTRRVQTGISNSIGSNNEFDQNEYDESSNKRRFSKEDERKQEEEEEMDDFDPMAPIDIFNSKAVLENEWDQIQKDMAQFLHKYAKDTLNNAYEHIFQVNYIFTSMNKEAQEALITGVEMIEKEEDGHENARKIITDFSNEMQRASDVLSRFSKKGNELNSLQVSQRKER
ncbi:uncharacterized protein I206_103571 [Kwoniella pini CBS 10737]|uniref:Uncharacterized protein n=1 Tax=Kwoniella pini CBS 10737 TaxID=1296096 RepID=A0A1B9I9G6_9TREE|nr:uncharacterized protein I206_01425 [Kwoniella pini CBS 10737]OCF52140.1 hypothetical protein I206_01425 [Kwoniella pini CBS 10737]